MTEPETTDAVTDPALDPATDPVPPPGVPRGDAGWRSAALLGAAAGLFGVPAIGAGLFAGAPISLLVAISVTAATGALARRLRTRASVHALAALAWLLVSSGVFLALYVLEVWFVVMARQDAPLPARVIAEICIMALSGFLAVVSLEVARRVAPVR